LGGRGPDCDEILLFRGRRDLDRSIELIEQLEQYPPQCGLTELRRIDTHRNKPLWERLRKRTRLVQHIWDHEIGGCADDEHDGRVHDQNSAATGKRPPAEAIDDGFDRRRHEDRHKEQEENFLDAPEHVHTDSEAEHQQEQARDFGRWVGIDNNRFWSLHSGAKRAGRISSACRLTSMLS
jgi:hypothetical protein